MPVRKYRSVSEMPDTGSVDRDSPELARIIAEVWRFSSRVAPATPIRGVRKLKDVQALNHHRRAWPVS